MDFPMLGIGVQHFNFPMLEIDTYIAAETVVIKEITLDYLTLIAQGDIELVEVIKPIVLHDVPEDGPTTDLDHRLWANLGFFIKARSQSTSKNNDFHRRLNILSTRRGRVSIAHFICWRVGGLRT